MQVIQFVLLIGLHDLSACIPAPNVTPDELCNKALSYMYNFVTSYKPRLSGIAKLTDETKIERSAMKFYVSESTLFRKNSDITSIQTLFVHVKQIAIGMSSST